MRAARLLMPILLLTACSERAAEPVALNLTDILGGSDVEGFERAYQPREFHFPKDHAAHPGFRNEWWYFTGNVADPQGSRYGYQVTFFRTAISPMARSGESSWAVRDLWMAHAAVTDINGRRHHASQRFSRANPGLAGASINPLRVWLDDWQLTANAPDFQDSDSQNSDPGSTSSQKGPQNQYPQNTDSPIKEFPWHLNIRDEDFSLQLSLIALKAPVLHGDQGLSQKSTTRGNASYYYSYSRLDTAGQLCLQGSCTAVAGLSWFDREWSTSSLDAEQSGWDWFSLQFDSGEELMYYQLLDLAGQADSNSSGSWIDRQGRRRAVARSEIELEVLSEWQSQAGQLYPVRWRMDYLPDAKSWVVQAAVQDQLMDLAIRYWEGAVEVYDTQSMRLVGRGYLEMTRSM